MTGKAKQVTHTGQAPAAYEQPDAVITARPACAEEAAEQTTYEVGDQVRLTRQSGRCGTIIGCKNLAPDAQPSLLVEVPGVPFVYAESAAHLIPAPPFPPTQTSQGTVTHANQAVQTYTSITALLLSTAEPTSRMLEQDCHRLLDALSSWSGISITQLGDALTAKRHTTSGPTRRPTETKAPDADISTNSDNYIASALPDTDSRSQWPSAKQTNSGDMTTKDPHAKQNASSKPRPDPPHPGERDQPPHSRAQSEE